MSVFRNVVFVAAIAGLLSGLFLTAVQSVTTVPLILHAESFEKSEEGGHSHAPATADAAPAHQHEAAGESWQPADGAERFLYTAGANILAGIGFALLLLSLAEALGGLKDWRAGLHWGLAGFVIFSLAPGLGLAPELPGMPVADLWSRQIWWVGTAIATAVGLLMLVKLRTPFAALAALILLVLPHLIGAPLPPSHDTDVPMDLIARFVTVVFASNLFFWALLGVLVAWLRTKFRHGEAAGELAVN